MMTRNRVKIVMLAVVFALATVLVSCKTASDTPDVGSQTIGSVTFADSDGALSGEDTRDVGSDSAPLQDGIVPPDVEGTVSTPLMWHVTSESGGELYLLGSIHAGLEDTCLFPAQVYDAFDSCDALAVENDVIALEEDLAASIKALRLMVYTDGSSISAHVSDETYEAAKALMEEAGYYNRLMDYYCPVVWQQTIDQFLTERTDFKYENGVDRYFLSQAKLIGKTVLEVEDYMETYAALASLSEQTQELLLRDTVSEESQASYGDQLAKLYGVWKAGELSEVEEFLGADAEAGAQGDYSAEELACLEEYNDVLLTNRNKIMVNKADEYLRDGKKVFYVVGLAHMIGNDGIVESLSAMGYEVEEVE